MSSRDMDRVAKLQEEIRARANRSMRVQGITETLDRLQTVRDIHDADSRGDHVHAEVLAANLVNSQPESPGLRRHYRIERSKYDSN